MRTVLFVEQTPQGELAKRLRGRIVELQKLLGFNIKVVERAGSTMKGKFPLNALWEGSQCPREDCVTCQQGAEFLPSCTRRNILYENFCGACNPSAAKKGPVKEVKEGPPSVYIGESSRSLYERSREHHAQLRSGAEDSHMRKHVEEHHAPGEQVKWFMRPVSYHRTALRRQIAEAVRIRRRGGEGAVLNSKSEYERCSIPRLTVELKEPMGTVEEEETTAETIRVELEHWEKETTTARELLDKEQRRKLGAPEGATGTKRGEGGGGLEPPSTSKRRKYCLLGEQWGELGGGEEVEPVTCGAREGRMATSGAQVPSSSPVEPPSVEQWLHKNSPISHPFEKGEFSALLKVGPESPSINTRAVRRLLFYAYFYYMPADAGLNSA